jgi:hypothetical protein
VAASPSLAAGSSSSGMLTLHFAVGGVRSDYLITLRASLGGVAGHGRGCGPVACYNASRRPE